MSTERETSVLEIQDKEVQEYQWDFQIPPRTRIQENIRAISTGGYSFAELKFKSGFLASIDHSWGVALYSNQINAYLNVPRKSTSRKLTVHPSKIELFSNGIVKATHKLDFHSDEQVTSPTNPMVLWAACWLNKDYTWDDNIDTIRFTIFVEYETVGRCIRYLQSDANKKRIQSLKSAALDVDATDFFMSEYLSDVFFEVDGEEFPAHRFLLTCKSPVFSKMFQHDMKEAKEGRIVVNDIDAKVLKELLRFLYCGKVENIESIADDLFVAADKYDLEALKVQCELALLSKVVPQNAIEMYTLAETHNAPALMERTLEILKRYKNDVIRDSMTFHDFALHYPELMFELYKL